MKISFVSIGHKAQDFQQTWIDLYIDRLSKFYPCALIRIDPKKIKSDASLIEQITKICPQKNGVTLLDETGRLFSTSELKTWWNKKETASTPHLCFVLGESYGFSESLKKHYPFHLSLSPLTMAHRLALLVLTEQIYRVISWNKNLPYHHEST